MKKRNLSPNLLIENYILFIRFEKNFSEASSTINRSYLIAFFQFLSYKFFYPNASLEEQAFLPVNNITIDTLQSIKTEDLEDYFLYAYSVRNLGLSYIQHIKSILTSFFKYLIKEYSLNLDGLLLFLYRKKLKRPEKPNYTLLTKETVKKLLVACENYDHKSDLQHFLHIRNKVLILMLYQTAVSVEFLINLLDRQIKINELNSFLYLDKSHNLVIPPDLEESIKSYRIVREEYFKRRSPTFFVSKNNRPLTSMSVRTIVKDVTQKAGIQHRCNPTILRYSGIKNMMDVSDYSLDDINLVINQKIGRKDLFPTVIRNNDFFSAIAFD